MAGLSQGPRGLFEIVEGRDDVRLSLLTGALQVFRDRGDMLKCFTGLFQYGGQFRQAGFQLGRRLFKVLQDIGDRSEEHTSELQSRENLVCRLLLEKKKTENDIHKRY